MPVANVAHGAGAVTGYAVGRAILSQRPRVGLGTIVACTLALSLLTLYMPWRYEWWWDRGNRVTDAQDAAKKKAYWRRAIDLAEDDHKVSELFLVLAGREAQAGHLAEADALIDRGVRVATHPENLRAWQAYFHWAVGETTEAAHYLSGVRMVDLDESLLSTSDFAKFTEETMHGQIPHATTRPDTQPGPKEDAS
jgi:hypothetical protein